MNRELGKAQGDTWVKSSYSGEQGDCVEVDRTAEVFRVRDSKDPAGPVMAFDRDAAVSFLTHIKAGKFDLA